MYAAMANQVATVEFLIKKNALITAQDHIGQTSLHFSAANVCQLLHYQLSYFIS